MNPKYPSIQEMIQKLQEAGRTPIVPAPNRWFADPVKHPFQQKMIERVLAQTKQGREGFPSGSYINPQTGEPMDFDIMHDLGVAIDPNTGRPMMSGIKSDLTEIDPKYGSVTKSNLVRKGLFKHEGGDELLKNLAFLATIEKSGKGHHYGLSTHYASPAELVNTMTGKNPTLRPHSRGDIFGVGDEVGRISIQGKHHPVYEKLLVAPAGSDVQGKKLHKAKGGVAKMNKGGKLPRHNFVKHKHGEKIGGYDVGDKIKNYGSYEASGISDIEHGIHKVPMSAFEVTHPNQLFYAKDDIDHVHRLAEQIKKNKYIDPLLVAMDKKGAYVLEGGHRLGAAHLLGMKEIPAIIGHEPDDYKSGGAVHMAKGGNLTVEEMRRAIAKASGSNPPMAEKNLTTLQDFHTSLGDNIKKRAADMQNMIESTPYKYDVGHHVFTEDSARKNFPPMRILSRVMVGNDPMRVGGIGSKVVKDPVTGKTMRTPHEAGYKVRLEHSPKNWSEFRIPESAIKGQVDMARGGRVTHAHHLDIEERPL
jgi:hypothetical protein